VSKAINDDSPATRLPGARAGQFGFTLVELIMVIVIVGIIGAVVAPRFFSRVTFDASGFNNQLIALLRHGQKLAIAQNRNVFVRVDGSSVALCYNATCSAGTRVQAPGSTNTASAATRLRCVDPATNLYDARWACEGVPDGVAMTAAATFYFDAAGTPFAAGDAQPTLVSTFPDRLTLTVSGAGVALTTSIEGGTGYVR
jgi:MSHA pilin protein MshC